MKAKGNQKGKSEKKCKKRKKEKEKKRKRKKKEKGKGKKGIITSGPVGNTRSLCEFWWSGVQFPLAAVQQS